MSNESNTKLFLGLDLGSVSLNCVILDECQKVLFKKYLRNNGNPLNTLKNLFIEIEGELGDISFSGAVITGSGKELVAEVVNFGTINEIVAHAKAAWTLHPEVKTVFEIGGQDSKYIETGKTDDGKYYLKDHTFNELCAAGTGAFLDQQAQRLGITIEELSKMAFNARAVPSIAGRCSVFAKSDMIHLQQKAVPTDEIAAGLCFALVRNYIAAICKGRKPQLPIVFQGGVAANKGVARAFKEILDIEDKDFIIPSDHSVTGAHGSALTALENPLEKSLKIKELIEFFKNASAAPEASSDLPVLKFSMFPKSPEPVGIDNAAGHLFMGIDVGSVSTKGVIIDSRQRLVASTYLPTAGRPVEAIKKLVDELKKLSKKNIGITHIAYTGSGRHLAKALFGCGTVMDEISAQSISSAKFFPDTDTIIEIGGQDSKFIKMSDGKIKAFKMNRACAAGTGSFLEEQAGRLGINIRNDFSDMAFKSENPVRLGSRCTVFMDSDLVHHIQRGAKKEDLCAGLAYSVAENYLEKVAGSTTVGENIIFQGGVAKNSALHAVFENLTGKPVKIHPYPEVSGALGAAFTAFDEVEQGNTGCGFSLSLLEINAKTESFVCNTCENLCEVRKITVENRETTFFGSICGRYEKGISSAILPDDPFKTREELLFKSCETKEGDSPRGEIGIPFSLTIYDYFPFWKTFFTKLGYKVILSDKTTKKIVKSGLINVPGEFCYPVKVLYGHIESLKTKNIKNIFVPHLRLFKPENEKKPRYACPYTQSIPYILKATMKDEINVMTCEYPVDGEYSYWVKETAKQLGINKDEIKKAADSALAAQDTFRKNCIEEGKKIIKKLEQSNKRGAVLIGRPYNTGDRYVNLDIARKLKELDIIPIPFDFIEPENEPMPELWSRIRWGYGRKLVQSARSLKHNKNLGAVIVTNFGCGPDAFIDQYLEYELKDVPHIIIELDDHQAEAGLVTRLEAFSRNFKITERKVKKVEGKDPSKPRMSVKKYTYYVPSFMDHAYAITGALKGSKCKTVMLPPTDEESWNLGMKYAHGRECHPFISFTGDLLKAAKQPGFVAKEACYFGPSYFGPCLLPQYPLALHLILERAGLADVTVMNITDPTNMKKLGVSYQLRMGHGIYSIDRFFKWKTEIEPYEAEKGSVDKVYREILLEIEKGLAENRFFKTLEECVDKFKAVPLSENKSSRPKIGIIGDAYTRVNCHSNNNLYQRLNEMGFEVWTSASMIDITFLGIEQMHLEFIKKGKPVSGMLMKSYSPGVKKWRNRIDKYFPDNIATPQERPFKDIYKCTEKYINFWIDRALASNISRIEEFKDGGADGIINVMCHNCMLGNVVSALSGSMKKDMDEIPICSIIYEGLKSTHNVNRLEAFTDQIKNCLR